MNKTESLSLPFKWPGMPLDGWRSGADGLTFYEQSDLPPLPFAPLSGNFGWLPQFIRDSKFSVIREPQKEFAYYLANQVKLIPKSRLARFGAEIDWLHEHHDLLSNFRSPIGSTFLSDTHIELIRLNAGDELACFMSDGQDSFHWFVRHVEGSTVNDVVCSSSRRFMTVPGSFLYKCASSFEEFLCRTLIENEIWFKLLFKAELGAYECDYLSFYKRRAG